MIKHSDKIEFNKRIIRILIYCTYLANYNIKTIVALQTIVHMTGLVVSSKLKK